MVEFAGGVGQILAVERGGEQAAASGEHEAEIIGETFVNPQQVVLHGLLVVGGGEAGWAAILSVPGVRVFVRQQAGGKFARSVVDEGAFIHAAVVGFVMLEAEVRDVIAQRVEEVIVTIMMRAKKLLRLVDEISVMIPNFLRSVERGGAVGGDIHFRGRVLRQRNDLEIFTGNDGRIDQRRQRDGVEVNLVGALVGNRKRGAEFPALGKLQRSGVVDLVGLPALGIKQNLVPTDDGELGSGGGSGGESTFKGGGREEVEFGIDLAHAGGDFHMDGVAVEQVAAPFERGAVGLEKQSGEIDDGAVRSVLAGDPFGIVEGEVAGSGGNFQRGVEKLAGSGGGIHMNRDGGRIRAPAENRTECDAENPQDVCDFHYSFGPSMIGMTPTVPLMITTIARSE